MTVVREGVAVQSFECFVESSLPRLVRFAGWVAGPGGDPQDLVHDALVRVGSRWDAVVSRPGDPEAYVRRAIVNGHVSRWRSRRREHLVDQLPDRSSTTGTPEDARHGQVWQAVQALPRGQRAVVALRFFEDMTVDESARALGVTEGTVKTQTSRALDALRRTLRSDGVGVDERASGHAARSAASGAPALVAAPGAAGRVAEDVASLRRRRRAAVGSAVAAAAAAVVALLVWSPWSSVDRLQPVVPAPPVQESTSPEVTPAPPEPSPPDQGALDQGAPDQSAPDPLATGAPAAAAPDLDIASYTFGIEETAQFEEASGLTRVTETATPFLIDPCRPTAYPTDARRTGYVGVSTYVGDAGYGAALIAYPDAAVAGEALAGFSRALDACGRLAEPTPAAGSGITQWTLLPSIGLGEESLTVASTAYVTDFGLPGSTATVIRIGPYLLEVYTDSMYAGDPDTTDRTTYLAELAGVEVDRLRAALADA